MTSLQKDVSDALRIDDIDKPATSIDAPATSNDAPAAETGVISSTPAIEAPVTPTTPEMPTPQTFVEAEAHAAAAEPLAITRETQPDAAPQDAAPANTALKDAKAS
jgi:sec-independent protein translocase protein TatB